MSFLLSDFIDGFPVSLIAGMDMAPWLIPQGLTSVFAALISGLDTTYDIKDNVAVHKTAAIEAGAVLKGPLIIGPHCFIGAGAYLRGGVYLDRAVLIGPGCEVKTSIIMSGTHLAHFNFAGDSLIGHDVNFEAGAIVCNHWNERAVKQIRVKYKDLTIETGIEKLGALVGDGCKIGANAVLSPGTLLTKGAIVKRLELIVQG